MELAVLVLTLDFKKVFALTFTTHWSKKSNSARAQTVFRWLLNSFIVA